MTGPAYDLSPLWGDRPPQEVRSSHRSTAPVAGWLVGGTLVFVGLVTTLVEGIGGSSEDVVIGLAFMAVGALLGLAAWLAARLGDRRAAGRTARIAAFARTNGFEFEGEAKATDLPGMPCRVGNASVYDRVRWSVRGLPAEAARYYRSSDGRGTTCSYLALRLDVPVEAATFDCGRNGPSGSGGVRKGPDAFEGKPYSLRVGGLALDPHARVLFDDPVVALLVDDQWPCNAEYVNGYFLAYYRSGDSADPGRWRHLLALADAVAARKQSLIAKS